MAKRNKRKTRKKRKRAQVSVGFPSPLAALLVTVGLLALVYLWLCSRCDALGKEITRKERLKEQVYGRRLNEEFKWSNMKSPRSMEALLKQHRLVMVLPAEREVVRVRPEGDIALAAGEAPRQYAQGRRGFMDD